MGYSPRDRQGSDMTEKVTLHTKNPFLKAQRCQILKEKLSIRVKASAAKRIEGRKKKHSAIKL